MGQEVFEKRVGKLKGSMEDVKEALDGVEDRQFYLQFFEEEARAKVARDNTTGHSGGYIREFKELMLQVLEVTKKEVLLAFQNGLKPWGKQEVEQRGIQKLSEAMTVVESMVKLGLGKNKLGSSKSEKRGVCKKNHNEDVDGNSNGDNSSNGKPQVGKKKPNRKMDKLKCFFCDGPHILKKCLKKFALSKKEKPVDKALGLGSRARGVEDKEVESEKKPVECFLCYGPHRLRKCPKKSVIEGDDGADNEPKKFGSSNGKAKANRAKRSKKKRVKCFLCHSLHELRNCPKQAVVKEKATSELSQSSEGLSHMEE
ncbi:hypothetical protein Gohar_021280, partial [Gossypium harknessii]|nr:hypothetical protein [Gossypium harknessii]